MNGDVGRSEPEPPSLPRKVHLVRGSEGYGFNLHGEKGIHGQFISAIDDGSPAFLNDVRVGDRVIGVNGEDVEELPHSKVVDKIRAGGNEVTLLVVDEQCDQFYKDLGMKIPQDKFEKVPENKNAPVEVQAIVTNGAEATTATEEESQEDNEREREENTGRQEEVIEERQEIQVESVAETAPKQEEHAAEGEKTEDNDAYKEVLPLATNKETIDPTPAPVEDTTPSPNIEEEAKTTRETEVSTPAAAPPPTEDKTNTPSDDGFKLDMSSARPKKKVKPPIRNWKEAYDTYEKL